MKKAILVLLGVCLLAAVVFGSVKLVEHYEGNGRSPYEKLEDELSQERKEGEDIGADSRAGR